MQHSKLLKIELGHPPHGHEVSHIEKDKPAIFIFEGDGSFDLEYAARKDNQYLARLTAGLCPDGAVNLYTIESDYYLRKGLIVRDYNNDPQRFTTPVIQELVSETMLKDTDDITNLSGTKRKAAVNSVKLALSRQMSVGYSIGGEIIQEMVNAMNNTLLDKGFTKSEAKECVEHFSAGTIGNPAILTPKQSNASQLHTILSEDETVFSRTDGKNQIIVNDPHPTAHLNYSTYGANNLAIISSPVSPGHEDGPHTYAVKLERRRTARSEDKTPEETRPAIPAAVIANPVRVPGQPPQPQWISKTVERETDGYHDLYLNTNIDRNARLDLQTYGFNPGANVFWEGMKRLMENARKGYGEGTYQPPAVVVEQIRTQLLSPEGKRTVMDKVKASLNAYDADMQWIKAQPGHTR